LSFGPISVLDSRFNSSEYCSMLAVWNANLPWPWAKILILR
jgi:hypothetical protein